MRKHVHNMLIKKIAFAPFVGSVVSAKLNIPKTPMTTLAYSLSNGDSFVLSDCAFLNYYVSSIAFESQSIK